MDMEIIIKHDDPERGVMVERYAAGNYDEEGQFWRDVRQAVDRLDPRGTRRSKAAAVPASAAPAPKKKVGAGRQKKRVSKTPPFTKAVKKTARKLKRR